MSFWFNRSSKPKETRKPQPQHPRRAPGHQPRPQRSASGQISQPRRQAPAPGPRGQAQRPPQQDPRIHTRYVTTVPRAQPSQSLPSAPVNAAPPAADSPDTGGSDEMDNMFDGMDMEMEMDDGGAKDAPDNNLNASNASQPSSLLPPEPSGQSDAQHAPSEPTSISVADLAKLSAADGLTKAFSQVFGQNGKNLNGSSGTGATGSEADSNAQPGGSGPGAMSAFNFIGGGGGGGADDSNNNANNVALTDAASNASGLDSVVSDAAGPSVFGFIAQDPVASPTPGDNNNLNNIINNNNSNSGDRGMSMSAKGEPTDDMSQEGGLFGNLSVAEPTGDSYSHRGSSVEESVGSSRASRKRHKVSKSLDMSIMAQVGRAQIDFERSKKSLLNNMKTCLDKEKRIKKRENSLNVKLADEKAKMKKAQEDKSLALKNDNYDEAAKLRNVLNRCQQNLLEIENQLTRCTTDLIRARKDKSRYELELLRNTENLRNKLSQFHEKHQESMTKFSKEEHSRIDEEEKTVNETLDDIAASVQENIETQEKCKDELLDIEDKIKDETEPINDKLAENEVAESDLEGEIARLKAELESKQSELLEVQKTIETLHQDAAKVRQTYQYDIDLIKKKQIECEENDEEYTQTKSDLEASLQDLKQQRSKAEQVEQDYSNDLAKIDAKITHASNTMTRLQDSETRHQRWESENNALQESVKSLQRTLDSTNSEISQLNNELANQEAKATHHRNILAGIDVALPKLASDKQIAVSSENYTEAGRIHKQIKQKEEQRSKSQTEMAAIDAKRHKLEFKMKELATRQIDIDAELEDTRTRIDRERFALLDEQSRGLKRAIQSVREEAQGVGEDQKERDVELNVLELELDQCTEELTMLTKKYGWRLSSNAANVADGSQDTQEPGTPTVTSASSSSSGSSSTQDTVGNNGAPLSLEPIETESNEQPDDKNAQLNAFLGSLSPKSRREYEAQIREKSKQTRRSAKMAQDELKQKREELETKNKELDSIKEEIGQAVAKEDYAAAGLLAGRKKDVSGAKKKIKEEIEKLEKEVEELVEKERVEAEEEAKRLEAEEAQKKAQEAEASEAAQAAQEAQEAADAAKAAEELAAQDTEQNDAAADDVLNENVGDNADTAEQTEQGDQADAEEAVDALNALNAVDVSQVEETVNEVVGGGNEDPNGVQADEEENKGVEGVEQVADAVESLLPSQGQDGAQEQASALLLGDDGNDKDLNEVNVVNEVNGNGIEPMATGNDGNDANDEVLDKIADLEPNEAQGDNIGQEVNAEDNKLGGDGEDVVSEAVDNKVNDDVGPDGENANENENGNEAQVIGEDKVAMDANDADNGDEAVVAVAENGDDGDDGDDDDMFGGMEVEDEDENTVDVD